MASQPAQGASGSAEWLFFPILLGMVLFILWLILKTPILYVSFYCSFFMFGWYENLTWLMSDTELLTIQGARQAIPDINPSKHGLRSLFMLMEIHGYILRWIAIPFMFYLGWRAKKRVVRFKYRRHIRNVYDLIEIQAKHFPASAIIRGKNLLNMHPYIGPWATYTLPLDFALDNGLLWTSKKRVSETDLVDEETMMPIPPFDPDTKLLAFHEKRELLPHYRYVLLNFYKANKVFAEQCGELWPGIDKLPPLEKALYAAFCAQASGRQEDCWKMIEQLAFSFKEGRLDKAGKLVTPHYANVKGTDELLKKYANRPQVAKLREKHAHKNNVIFATLALARKKGRLTHANFLWVKPVNRTLWYCLCGQGGQVPYWEAAGPWAHLQVEESTGHRIPKPMVAGAVAQVKFTMSREHWIDPGEFSEEHQQKLVAEANAVLDEAAKARKSQGKGPRGAGALGSQFVTPPNKRQGNLINGDDEP